MVEKTLFLLLKGKAVTRMCSGVVVSVVVSVEVGSWQGLCARQQPKGGGGSEEQTASDAHNRVE